MSPATTLRLIPISTSATTSELAISKMSAQTCACDRKVEFPCHILCYCVGTLDATNSRCTTVPDRHFSYHFLYCCIFSVTYHKCVVLDMWINLIPISLCTAVTWFEKPPACKTTLSRNHAWSLKPGFTFILKASQVKVVDYKALIALCPRGCWTQVRTPYTPRRTTMINSESVLARSVLYKKIEEDRLTHSVRSCLTLPHALYR